MPSTLPLSCASCSAKSRCCSSSSACLRAALAAPALLPVARRLRTSLFGAEPYDAVHVRLGDFGDLCGAAADPADRKYKFCPPADDELRRVFGELEKYGETAAPVLLLSDEPVEAARRLGGDARLRIPANASLVDAPRLAVEMHLAAHARLFVGVACSTVSQLIVKRRQAKGRDYVLWP